MQGWQVGREGRAVEQAGKKGGGDKWLGRHRPLFLGVYIGAFP